jgi:uncharacterized protein YneF (UPF0154 family)
LNQRTLTRNFVSTLHTHRFTPTPTHAAINMDLPIVTPTEFRIGTRVQLTGLKQIEFNGRIGVVQSRLDSTTGRQQVALDGDQSSNTQHRVLGLKPSNLLYAPRPINSLSVKELKTVLSFLQGDGSTHAVAGLDKGQLREMVSARVDSDHRIAAILSLSYPKDAEESVKKNESVDLNEQITAGQMHAQAQQLANTSPDQLRQQAQMMRSMDPSTIRRMNSHMAHFTDSQIRMAADQLEMLANNPSMVQGVLEQMKNMTPQELEQARQMHVGNSSTSPTASGQLNRHQMQQGAMNMANMTPDEIREQAQRLKSMDPDLLRRMNPAMKNLTDAQIRQVVSQMENMADNPQLVQSMAQQMQHMTPDDWDRVQDDFSSNITNTSNSSTIKPKVDHYVGSCFSSNQMKQTIEMMKSNPSMVRDMIKMQHPQLVEKLSDEQLDQMLSSFAKMDEKSVDRVIRGLGMMQKSYQFLKRNKTCVVLIVMILLVGACSSLMGFRPSNLYKKPQSITTVPIIMDRNIIETAMDLQRSDDSEFDEL